MNSVSSVCVIADIRQGDRRGCSLPLSRRKKSSKVLSLSLIHIYPLAAARNFLNAIERIPSIIDQYKAKNEGLEREIPQLQDIAGKVGKKEDELKQLKSELAALDRKIQLELAPPTPEVAEKDVYKRQAGR